MYLFYFGSKYNMSVAAAAHREFPKRGATDSHTKSYSGHGGSPWWAIFGQGDAPAVDQEGELDPPFPVHGKVGDCTVAALVIGMCLPGLWVSTDVSRFRENVYCPPCYLARAVLLLLDPPQQLLQPGGRTSL